MLVPPRYSSLRSPPTVPTIARPPSVVLATTSAALPPVAGPSGSALAVPPAAHSPVIEPLVGGGAGPSTANPLFPSVIATAEISPAKHDVRSGKGYAVSPLQPLPEQPARRNNARSHEIVETGDSSLVVRRGQHAIRDKKGKTTWFYSDGQTYLLEPPVLHNAGLGDLYVHTASNRDLQIWIFNRNSQWEKIQLHHPHPILPGYVLHIVSDGEPRWVQKSTITTYSGREKRYQKMASQTGAETAPVTSSGQAARFVDIL